MRRVWLFFGTVLVLFTLWNGRPPTRSVPMPTVYAVADSDTLLVRTTSDSIYAHLGVVFDSVVLSPDRTLRLVVQRGMLARPVRMTATSCASGPDPYPATQHVAERMYAPYGRHRQIQIIVVQTRGNSAIDGGWFHRHSCGGGVFAAYYYRARLDSIIAAPSDALLP